MGNQTSRPGDYGPRYPPKQAYYSDRGTRRKHARTGGRRRYPDGVTYEQREYSEYPHPQYPYFNPSLAQQPFAYGPPPPPHMIFAPPPQAQGYPVVPPMPVPTQTVVVPNPVQIPQPSMHMPFPQPMPAPSVPPPSATPVIPPVPQTGTGTPFPTATGPPVIPHTPDPFPQPQHHQHLPPRYAPPSSSDSSSEEMGGPPEPTISTAQFALRNLIANRPDSIVFHRHPLPAPPKDVFENSPYIGLLESLHRPADEILTHSRSASLPQPTGYVMTPVGSQAHRPKKQRKGLLRTLSERLTGKKRPPEPEMLAVPVMQPVMFAAPPGVVHPTGTPAFDPTHFQPGVIPHVVPGASPAPMVVPPSPSYSPAPPPPPKTSSPVPSAHSHMHSPQRQSPSLMPLIIDLVGEFAGLTHLSNHPVHFNSKLFPSALHALEAQRFVESRPEVVEDIQHCNTQDEVRAIVSHNNMYTRPDWDQIVLHVMEDVLHDKFTQHPDLRRLLLSTGNMPLQFNAAQDNFWGDGPLGQGANHLGKALERVRERLKAEGYSTMG